MQKIFLVIIQIFAVICIIKCSLNIYLKLSRVRMEEEYNLSTARRYMVKLQDCLDNKEIDCERKSLEIRLYSTAILEILDSENSRQATKEINDFFYENNINISYYKLPNYSLN